MLAGAERARHEEVSVREVNQSKADILSVFQERLDVEVEMKSGLGTTTVYATSTSSSPCTFVRATSVACAQLPRNTTVTRP